VHEGMYAYQFETVEREPMIYLHFVERSPHSDC
jgi:hypothetical protein